MSAALAVNVAAWLWGLAGLALIITVAVMAFSEAFDEYPAFLAMVGMTVSGIGSLVFALHIIASPIVALWTWRVAGVVCVLVSLISVRGLRPGQDVSVVTRLSGLLSVVAPLVVATASFLTQSIPPVKLAAAGAAAIPNVTIDGVRLWHGVALGVLGLGTIVFLLLFVRMVERGFSLQVESNWGGIGGGMAGWRVSPSLTYFAAAAIFGVLFAIFVFQLERPAAGGTASAPATPTAKPPK
jgi:hypothetical protein